MLRKIKEFYYSIDEGISNFLIWYKIIWRDRQFDHSYLLSIMALKLSLMEHHFKFHACHIGADRDTHNLMICKNLIKRLEKENYLDSKSFNGTYNYKREEEMENQDLELFCKVFQKQVRCWWD